MLFALLVGSAAKWRIGLEPFLLSIPESLLGTIPGWITAGSLGSILWLLMRGGLTFRGQSLNAEQNIRDHYAKELDRLTRRLDEQDQHFRARVKESNERHDECMREREELRQQLSEVRKELDGVHRQIARYSADKLMILEDETGVPGLKAPDATASAARVKDTTK